MNKAIVLISTFVCLAERIAAIDVCQRSELGSLLTNSNTTSCATDSSVVFSSLNGAPSDEQLATICETDTCRSLMAAILVINPEDCTLPLNENLNLMSDLVDPVVEKCTSMGIDITGSSKVGSDSGVNVGDDSVAFDSNA
uniref:Elicitin n=1 Tax=Phytophthora capsici TaxID=4784 RepID=A0A0A7DNT6_PHYCP|nr:elicitin 113574 [Phytophthora capsici]